MSGPARGGADARLQAVLDSMPVGVVTLDADAVVVDANPAACRILRRPREEIAGLPLESLAHRVLDARGDPLRPSAHPARRAIARGHTVPRQEIGLEDRRGRVTWLAGGASPLPGVDGPGGAVWSFADVGGRRREAAALRDSEERYRSVVSVMSEGVVLVYADGRPGACNRAAEAILGMPADEILRRPLAQGPWEGVRTDGAAVPAGEHPVVMTLRTGVPLSGVLMGVTRGDGTEASIEVATEPLVAEPGAPPHGVVATVMDVSARLRAERELRDSEGELRAVVETLGHAVVVADARGVIRSANPAAERILGVPAAEMAGRSIADPGWELVDEHGVPLAPGERPGRHALDTGRPTAPRVLGVRRADGGRAWVEAAARPLIAPGAPDPYAVVLTATDLAARDEGALLRVAVAAAGSDDPAPVLALAAAEAMYLLRADGAAVRRAVPAGVEGVAHAGAHHARGSAVIAPIVVRGRPWGEIEAVAERAGAFGAGDEERLARVAELVGGAVQHAEERRRLVELATTDPLTGLANARGFRARLEEEAARARRHGRPLAMVMLDVDRFKAVNDEHGHHVGDLVIAEVARRLRATARPHDVIGRLGGDEFGWVLPEATAAGARGAAERARAVLAAEPLPEVGRRTASAGVADLAGWGGSTAAMAEAADAALYAAKATGRDRCVSDPAGVLAGAGAAADHATALASLRALARATEGADPSIEGVGERLADAAGALAAGMGWPADRVARLREACMLAALDPDLAAPVLDGEQASWLRRAWAGRPPSPAGVDAAARAMAASGRRPARAGRGPRA